MLLAKELQRKLWFYGHLNTVRKRWEEGRLTCSIKQQGLRQGAGGWGAGVGVVEEKWVWQIGRWKDRGGGGGEAEGTNGNGDSNKSNIPYIKTVGEREWGERERELRRERVRGRESTEKGKETEEKKGEGGREGGKQLENREREREFWSSRSMGQTERSRGRVKMGSTSTLLHVYSRNIMVIIIQHT